MIKPTELKEIFEAANDDPLFISLIGRIERCESYNGHYGCWKCPKIKACLALFDNMCDVSSKNMLNAEIARIFIEKFNRILLH